MAKIDGWLHRLRVLIAPKSYEREVQQEIRFHLDLEAMQMRSAGQSDANAEATARKHFGNVTYTREEVRRVSGMERFDRIRQNLEYAIRGLNHSRMFTLAVVLTLGLGLGVNAAIFDFLDRVFVRAPAAVEKPEEVRRLYIEHPRAGARGAREGMMYPHVRSIARAADAAGTLGLFTTRKDTTIILAGAQQIRVQRSMANAAYFRVLGVRLALGRTFDVTEDRIDVAAPVAIISHDLWQRSFHGDPAVVGSVVRVNERSITIIGVAIDGFSGIQLDRVDLWMPSGNYDGVAVRKTPWYEWYAHDFAIVTRFADPAVERRFLNVASRAYREIRIEGWGQDSLSSISSGPVLSALGPADNGQEISISLRLGGVSFIVLLIALANVSNLLMVRASKRGREIAVRRALGASRGRLFEQFLTESVVLALISLAVSVTLAFWVSSALRSVLLPGISWSSGPLDLRSLMIAVGATLLVGIVIGLAPAIHVWRPDLISSLRAGSTGKGYQRSRATASLVVAQAALSVILLVGAGLFVRSLSKVHAIDVGYDVNRMLLVQPLSSAGGPPKSLTSLMPDLLRRLASIPGVEMVASISRPPMGGATFGPFFFPDHRKLPSLGGDAEPSYLDVSPDYFRASGVRILSGRVFTEGDKAGMVVGETMAKAYWPGESPLGKCAILDEKTQHCVQVIGVVADVNRFQIIEGEQKALYYISTNGPHRAVVMRVAPERQKAIIAVLESAVRAVVPEAAIIRPRSLATIIDPQFRPWRLGAVLFTAMGVLALVVAAIGVYSVVSYMVSQRTNEMGIRIALGAKATDILRLVVGDGLRTVAVGIALGVVLSMAMAGLIASLLYGVSARDPLVLGAAALILGSIGLAASLIPAMRAARVTPMEALRVD